MVEAEWGDDLCLRRETPLAAPSNHAARHPPAARRIWAYSAGELTSGPEALFHPVLELVEPPPQRHLRGKAAA